ncbi:MAG: PHP-associated domain-containing protein, partial [Planctomycetota bacterium]
EGHLTILAHPFRYEGGAMMLGRGLRPEAIELLTNNHSQDKGQHTRAIAAALDIPTVNAGDVHALDFIGKYWIETTRPLENADDIRQIILSGNYRNRSREDQ